MTQKTSTGCTLLSVFYRRNRLMQGLGLIGGLGVLSSSIVWAQTDPNPDTMGGRTNQQVNRSEKSDREPAVRRPSAIERDSEPSNVRRRSTSENQTQADTAPKRQRLRPPSLSVPDSSEEVKRPSTVSQSPAKPARNRDASYGDNSAIDSTNYSIGATGRNNSKNRSYDAPSSVVLSERSTGCRRVIAGQGLGGCNTGTSTARTPDRLIFSEREIASLRSGNVNSLRRSGLETQIEGVSRLQRSTTEGEKNWVARQQIPVAAVDGFNIGPVRVSAGGIGVGSSRRQTIPDAQYNTIQTPEVQNSIVGSALPYFNPRSPVTPPLNNANFIFPLSIPAPITSLFGWRVHPITGDRRLHAGTDLGAPLGTPVLAAYAGQVALADWMGGYGLAVVLQHDPAQQTLYGHLSELLVKPGQWVEQGTVIGKVGSTGNSTGPHLHFEWRQLTVEGWMATDPGAQLEYAMAQMMQALQVTQAPIPTAQPGG